MLKEGALPTNIDPSDPKIDDPIERARIMRAFERHLDAPTGYVLPVQRWSAQAQAGWVSEVWQTRRGGLFLAPGDSPIGFRLPLSSLPMSSPSTIRISCRPIPFAERGELPDPALARDRRGRARSRHRAPPLASGGEARPRKPAPRRPRRHSGAHRAHRRAARRPALRVHAAGRNGSRTISSCSPSSKRPPPSSACRCRSKAMRRRPIRASTSSR